MKWISVWQIALIYIGGRHGGGGGGGYYHGGSSHGSSLSPALLAAISSAKHSSHGYGYGGKSHGGIDTATLVSAALGGKWNKSVIKFVILPVKCPYFMIQSQLDFKFLFVSFYINWFILNSCFAF